MARDKGKAKPNALVAAATKVKLDDKRMAQRQASRHQEWQGEAWAFFDEVPEIKYATWFLGNAMAKLRLYAATRPPSAEADSDPIAVDDPDAQLPPDLIASATAELERLRNTSGGHPGLLRRLNMNFEVAGDCWLIGLGEIAPDAAGEGGRAEDWHVRSISEVTVTSGVYKVKDGPNDQGGTPLDADNDTAIRLWQEHPQWAALADCSMRGVLGECKTLQVLSQQVLAQAMRAASAGFFTVPNELSFGPADPTQGEDGQEASGDPLLDVMTQVLMNPIEDPSDPATVQPGLIRGPGEYLTPDYLRLIRLWDPSIDASLEERIKARIERIARGLNLPVEVVMGHQQTTYANAEQVDQDTFEDHLEPRCTLIVDALTTGYLRPNLLDSGYPPELVNRVMVWYDPSALVRQPDTEANAKTAHDLNLISDTAGRKHLGYSEDDAPDPLELLIRAGLRRGGISPVLTEALIQALADEAGVALPDPNIVNPSRPGSPPPAGATSDLATLAQLLLLQEARRNGNGHRAVESAEPPPFPVAEPAPERANGTAGATLLERLLAAPAPRRNYGRLLMELDRDLRTRLLMAVNDAMARALERAGNRLRTKANGHREALRHVKPREVAATLGPTIALAAATAEEALSGSWDDLEAQFMAWGQVAQGQALSLASQACGGFATTTSEALALRQAADLAGAWEWLRDELGALAEARMFDPNPAAPEVGEHDPTLHVQPGVIRQALARAGGTGGLMTAVATAPGPAGVLLTDGGTRPAGGIGTGELLRGAMRDEGVTMEAYRWSYGPALRHRPFLPHQQLDGVVFRNFDDEVLANSAGFPEFAFYMPGDHDGSLAPGTVVSGPAATGAALRHWRGVLVHVTTASGQFLATTPNHPILTGRGWVPAGELVEGDEVVRCRDAEGVAALIPHDHQVPARIEDVVAAVSMRPGMAARTVEVAPMHFHGDGVGSQVAVVWADRDLWHRREAAFGQPSGQDPLAGADTDAPLLAGEGGTGQGLGAVGAAPLGRVGGSDDLLAALGRALAGEEQRGLAEPAALDAEADQALSDGAAVYAVTGGQGDLGLAGLIELDKLTEVRREFFEGHVYDLQTAERWYVAGGIIAHNCICDAEPILASAAELGLSDGDLGDLGDGELDAGDLLDPTYPAEDMSWSEAQRWMMDRWGVDANGAKRAILLDGMGTKGANVMARTMDALMRQFPNTAERVRIFGSSSKVTAALKDQLAGRYRISNMSPRAYADTAKSIGWIRVAGAKAKRYEELIASLESDVAAGFHPTGTGSLESVVTHEFGHNLYWTATQRAPTAANQALESVFEQLLGIKRTEGGYFKARYELIRSQIGRYALTNNDELMAEAFAMVMAGEGSPLATELVNVLINFAEG